MTPHDRAAALRAAREELGIEDSLHAIDAISIALERLFGFEELPASAFGPKVLDDDPSIKRSYVARVLTVVDQHDVDAILTEEDQKDRDQTFGIWSPASFGPEKRWFGLKENPRAFGERMQTEHREYRRVTVVLETDPAETVGLGNYQVFGAGQRVKEYLWALSGIIPRDPGTPISEHYRRCVR